MAAIKSAAAIASKWANVTPSRSQDYADGVASPRVDWQKATMAAAASYKAGVTAAANEGRFEKSVGKTPTSKWQSKTQTLGVQRWGPGVQQAQDAYQIGFSPYQAAIAALQLPPRAPRRDPRNLDRVRSVVDAMIATRKTQGG